MMEDQELQAQLAKQRAELDQAVAGIKGVAEACAQMFNTMTQEGVPAIHAATITGSWVSAMAMSAQSGGEEDG